MNVEGFISSLPTALWGMLGVFLVIFLVYITIVILNKLFPGSEE
ncbi:hypothetical protein [Guggenheimella bovis]